MQNPVTLSLGMTPTGSMMGSPNDKLRILEGT
jgi:hypothetical protein